MSDIPFGEFHIFWSKGIWPTNIWQNSILTARQALNWHNSYSQSSGLFVIKSLHILCVTKMSVGQMFFNKRRGTLFVHEMVQPRVASLMKFNGLKKMRRDFTQHNDIQNNSTQHNNQ
jgi:hypothetical protein